MYWRKRFDVTSPEAALDKKIQAIRKIHKDFGYRRI